MKNLWLLWLPLLFLPNWGTEQQTALGTLQISDYLIGPYIVLLVAAIGSGNQRERLLVHQLIPLMLVFIWWTVIATLLIPLRYDYVTNSVLFFSLLKIAKLILYTVAGLLTIKALATTRAWLAYNWSLLAAGFVVGLNLFITRNTFNELFLPGLVVERAYQDNPISALVSILIIYFLGLRLIGYGSQRWQRLAVLVLSTMTIGTFLSNGRGGWVAAFVGLVYILYRLKLRRTLLAVFIGIGLVLLAYRIFPTFEEQIEKTFWPERQYLERYDAGIAGIIDDGARLSLLRREGVKLVEAPILGRGFFHRGGESGLLWWGSHNFFAQIFLETGIVGGLLMLSIWWQMWRQGGLEVAQATDVELPVRAALLTAFTAGLSGEYYYGGMTLFTLLLVYGAMGRLPYAREAAYGEELPAGSEAVLQDQQVTA